MVGQAEVTQLRQAQAGILALLSESLTAFFASLDLEKPDVARDALLEYLPLLVAQYGDAGAAAAADWYDDVRAVERVPGRYRAEVAEPVPADVVEASVRFSAGHLYTATPALALPSLLDSSSKRVLVPARFTVMRATERDPRAVGWQRVTRSGGCKFCRFLAQRGAVYRERVADFASHGHCNCATVPSWDEDAPEVDVRAYVASRKTSAMSPADRAEHTAKLRDAVDAFVDD